MSDDAIVNLYNKHRESQDKHTYFLLAASASGIGFLLNQTKDVGLSFSQIPLGLALLCWGLSFFLGCKRIQSVQAFLFGNHQTALAKEDGELSDEEFGIKNAALDLISEKANCQFVWQFRFLTFGGLLYIAWHIITMYLRTA